MDFIGNSHSQYVFYGKWPKSFSLKSLLCCFEVYRIRRQNKDVIKNVTQVWRGLMTGPRTKRPSWILATTTKKKKYPPNNFIESWLTCEKLYIFNVYNVMNLQVNMYNTRETINTINIHHLRKFLPALFFLWLLVAVWLLLQEHVTQELPSQQILSVRYSAVGCRHYMLQEISEPIYAAFAATLYPLRHPLLTSPSVQPLATPVLPSASTSATILDSIPTLQVGF